MTNVVCFGECMIETSNDGLFRFGGDSLNTALYLARTSLSSELSVWYATAIGVEPASEKLLSAWQSEGIKTDLVLTLSDKNVGAYKIKLNDEGERSFDYQRSDSAAKQYIRIGYDLLAQKLLHQNTDCFYFTGISLAILPNKDLETFFNLLTAYKKAGGRIIFDNNYRAILWQERDPKPYYYKAMQLSDIAFLTDEDEYTLFGGNNAESILTRYQASTELQQTELVIKQGAAPCIVRPITCASRRNLAHHLIRVESQQIPIQNIVDTSAAGDAFSAGYLAKRLSGSCINSSAKLGHLLAGRVIQFHGAIIPAHSMNDIAVNKPSLQ